MSSCRVRIKFVVNKRRGRHLDRISSLPDELLVHVLSFLPTRCAVATSVLSTRWRHLFTLSAVLSFDDAPCFDGGPYDSQYGCRQLKEIDAGQKRRFRKFVKKVLESHQLVPVKKFSLVCYGDYDKSDINAWVRFAVQKGVEDLHYQVNVFGDPDDIFTCETLVRLKIIGLGDYLMGVPLSACFPRLKVLHLDDVNIVNYDYVERLFSGSELLEELTLRNCELAELYIDRPIIISTRTLKILRVEYCSLYGLIEIDAPNLTHLTTKYASGIKIVPSWKQACSLAKAELQFLYNTEDSDTYDDFELLKAAAHKVTDLDISASSVELLLMLFGPEETPDFPRLTRLNLSKCPYYAWEHVTSFLDKSPLLENLVFKTGLRRDTDSQLPSNEDLPPFTCHAKVIEVHDFCGSEYSLLNVGHLLKNAGALKKLILRKSYTVDMAEELRICKVLLNLPKASKDCFIELTSPSIP